MKKLLSSSFCFAMMISLAGAQEAPSVSKRLFDGQGSKVEVPALSRVKSAASAFKESEAKERSDSGLTKYQILAKLYNGASSPASEGDFDSEGQNSNQHCIKVFDYAPNNSRGSTLKRVERAPSGDGPLFPEPEPREKKLSFLDYALYWNGEDGFFKRVFDKISYSQVGKDLVWHVDYVAAYNGSPMTVDLRKSSNLIFFSGTLFEGRINAAGFYGYCWREESPAKSN